MTDLEHDSAERRITSFLGLLFAVDSAALVFFLVVRQGGQLPAKLPFRLGPYLPFEVQVLLLAGCAGAILVFRALALGRPDWLICIGRWVAWCVLAVTLFAIATGGMKILGDPRLVAGG